ncbi:uncharacterized protein [Argopecten irradians]|uniref:uncharacterized protein n=1 Tax=Argopecten irradians TaxID=31199 RepID=UPI00371D0290
MKPLHIGAQLDLKRNVSYLMEAGWDLDEKDQSGKTPVQMANPVLAEYMRCCKYPREDMRNLQPQDGVIPCDGILPIDMERVDLPDMTVYTPCFQIRKTFQRKQQKLLFASRYFTTYYNVCQQQAFGILWTLSRYGKDILHCLDDIYLMDFTIQSFHDVGTGKLDISAWILNNDRRQPRPQEQRNQQTQADDCGPSTTWIQHILRQDVHNFQAELQNGIELLEDGWTPLHYAILTRQHHIITSLLENQFGYLGTRTKTLLPQFVLEELKLCCKFEYNYVFRHMTGFTPLLLSTFIGDTDAINIIGKHVSVNRDLGDCLQLAYCEDVEKCLLDVMCSLGERHIRDKYSLNVKLHSVYEKWCPNRRILICSSNDINRRIEEDFPPVRLVLDNNSIIRKSFEPAHHNMSKEDEEELSRVINDNSDELWTRHSNLNAILPGISNDGKGHVIVILHCSHKGFIHTGELPFKRYLSSQGRRIRVLAIQGRFRLGPTVPETTSAADSVRGNLRVGYKVKYLNNDMMATLGMMVVDDEGNTGILTCAHTFINEDLERIAAMPSPFDQNYYDRSQYRVDVLLRKPELLVSYNEFEDESEEMEVEESQTSPSSNDSDDCEMEDVDLAKRSCGYIRRLIFKQGQSVAVAIDVALIMLDKDAIECSPELHFSGRDRDDEKMQLKAVDKDFKRKHLKFTSGKIFKQADTKFEPGPKIIKCGIKTGLSLGTLAFESTSPRAQVKVTDGMCSVQRGSSEIVLKGQMLVDDKEPNPFFLPGDSGSAVFVNIDNSLECVGMGIGKMTSSPQTLVTPMKDIIDALREQPAGASRPREYKLKSFD